MVGIDAHRECCCAVQLSFDEHMAARGREYLEQVLANAGGNVALAARIAGRNRTDFYKLLQKHGVEYLGRRNPFASRGNTAWRALA